MIVDTWFEKVSLATGCKLQIYEHVWEKLCKLMELSGRFWASIDVPLQMLWLTQWESLVSYWPVKWNYNLGWSVCVCVCVCVLDNILFLLSTIYCSFCILFLLSAVQHSILKFKLKLSGFVQHTHTHTIPSL